MLGFWIFMLIMDLLLSATMIGFGTLFLNEVPRSINSAFGYRTAMSMKNQDTWQFAHRYCGKLWLWSGWISIPLSILPLLLVFGKEIDTIAYVGLAVTFLQAIPLIGPIIPTEIALRKAFDQNGRRRREY